MTGQRRVRGRLGDDRRVPGDRQGSQPVGAHTELEELSTSRVTAGRRSRPGLQTILAAAGLMLLLGVGLGALGGRQASAEPSSAAIADVTPSAPALAPGQAPAVTPAAACAEPPAAPPDVLLEVDDATTAGLIEVLERPVGVTAAILPSPAQPPAGTPTRVPPSAAVGLRISGGACAHAWTIAVGSRTLESQGNAGLNPAYASQNRFELYLADFAGSVVELQADLVFQTMAVRATWPLILVPGAILEGAQYSTYASESLGALLLGDPPALSVRSQEQLTFSLPEWQIRSAFLVCGYHTMNEFIADPLAGCAEDDIQVDTDESGADLVRFPAPAAEGQWTIAIETCMTPMSEPGSIPNCGTWYADVEVRDS